MLCMNFACIAHICRRLNRVLHLNYVIRFDQAAKLCKAHHSVSVIVSQVEHPCDCSFWKAQLQALHDLGEFCSCDLARAVLVHPLEGEAKLIILVCQSCPHQLVRPTENIIGNGVHRAHDFRCCLGGFPSFGLGGLEGCCCLGSRLFCTGNGKSLLVTLQKLVLRLGLDLCKLHRRVEGAPLEATGRERPIVKLGAILLRVRRVHRKLLGDLHSRELCRKAHGLGVHLAARAADCLHNFL
mmetsp:Transcript_1724/g.4851  ORF Transcript_1724/g.4851 Transcript_1724/m.4851 type:complete len:240 (-) Transcript_1724:242-961(-)